MIRNGTALAIAAVALCGCARLSSDAGSSNTRAAEAHAASAVSAPPPETVILIHGMGRTRVSLALLARRLRGAGYRVHNFPYDTVRPSLDEITAAFAEFVHESVRSDAAQGAGEGSYHLIGHSLGNVIIRAGAEKGYPPGLSRIVMLAPPNRPPQLASRFRDNPIYRWRCGDAGRRLADPEFYATLPIPDAEFGVIAGTRGHGLTFDEPNDGVVACEETRLEGMTDWIALRHSHTFLMNSGDTFDQCVAFLRRGRFDHPAD